MAGSTYGAEILTPFYRQSLCSPAPRCVETANLFIQSALVADAAAIEGGAPELDLETVLYDGTMQPSGSRLFKKIGYAPLRSYLDNPNIEDADIARDVLRGYSRDVIKIVESTINAAPSCARDDGGIDQNTLLIFGHAIYLPSAALGIAAICGCDRQGEDIILSTNTNEAEGFLIDVERRKVSLLCRPENQ